MPASSPVLQLFLAQGKEILISGEDCVEEGVLGQGAYATVFQVKIKRRGDVSSLSVSARPTKKLWLAYETRPTCTCNYV